MHLTPVSSSTAAALAVDCSRSVCIPCSPWFNVVHASPVRPCAKWKKERKTRERGNEKIPKIETENNAKIAPRTGLENLPAGAQRAGRGTTGGGGIPLGQRLPPSGHDGFTVGSILLPASCRRSVSYFDRCAGNRQCMRIAFRFQLNPEIPQTPVGQKYFIFSLRSVALHLRFSRCRFHGWLGKQITCKNT